MKAQIEITNQYGFAYYWTLIVTKGKQSKSFYLGQDVKFCDRVLGMSPSYVVEQIGTRDISSPAGNKRLANFILDTLDIDTNKLFELESWSLCAE